MDETLKPCPFCGTPAEAQTYPGGVRVGCVALECTVAPEVDGATLAIAAALWNTRAAPREPEEAERLAALLAEPHFLGSPSMDGGGLDASAVMVSSAWYTRLKALAARPDAGDGRET